MRRIISAAAAIALASALSAACNLLNKNNSSTPTSPSAPTVSLTTFAGTWSSATVSAPPTGCGNVKYTVTPLTTSTANVTFAATCGGNITVNGTGTGTLSGSTLDWSAQGLVGQGAVNCPFTFTNGKATSAAADQMTVVYSGTVCGIPVSGTETVKK